MTYRTARRIILHAVLLALIATASASSPPATAHRAPDWIADEVATRAAQYGAAPARVLAVIDCETGHSYSPFVIGRAGERGLGQWLAGGHWYATPHYRELGVDVRAMYRDDNPDAVYWDIDGLAWAFSPLAPSGFWRGWSCAT